MDEVTRKVGGLRLNAQQMQILLSQVAGDSKFQAIFDQIHSYRESAIADLGNDAVVENVNKILTTIGEIRAYTALLSLAGEATHRVPAPEPSD